PGDRARTAVPDRPAVAAADGQDTLERARQERLVGAAQVVRSERLLGGLDPVAARQLEDKFAGDALEQPFGGRRREQAIRAHDEDVARSPLRQTFALVQQDRLIRPETAGLAPGEEVVQQIARLD